MLKYVIASGFSTAFIIEDDVDWDVDIKDQIRLISDNVRTLTNAAATDTNPYGSGWDLLWLGHCGERSDVDDSHVDYPDPTRIASDAYAGWSKEFLAENPPAGYRRIQQAVQPVCTFGYGITKHSAQKILALLSRGADESYDVALQHQCISGSLNCLVVNPQIMVHYEPPNGLGYVSAVHEGDGQGSSAEDEVFETVKGTTANIVHSARCQALFHDTCLAPSRGL
jgi:hypothetical protein